MKALSTILLAAGALLLAGCGPRNEFAQAWQAIQAARSQNAAQQAQPTDLRTGLTAAMLAEVGRPTVLVTLPERDNVQALFFEEAHNADTVTWLSVANEFVLLQRGVLSGTRGLGDDLMSADLAEVHAALAGRRTQAVRIHRRLDGENHTVAESYVCDYVRRPGTEAVTAYLAQVQARRVDETCTGIDRVFENRYWLSGSGQVIRAVQWAGESIGYLNYERLRD